MTQILAPCLRGGSRSAFLLTLCLLLAGATSASAHTLYVSPHGSDRASGLSPDRAWRTVSRVDRARLRPGDRVLFQGGAAFGDNTLMPGWGLSASGTAHVPIVFSSYGRGRARLAQGIWIKGESHLRFSHLQLGPEQGISGTGADIVVAGCLMRNFFGAVEIPLQPEGSHWIIIGNTIDRTGDSGMLLRGDHYLVAGNTVTHTGLDRRLTYGSHGVYLKASDSSVIGNRIIGFRDNGVSVRYGNSVVLRNFISGGKFGIAWFQAGTDTNTSNWSQNTITRTTIAGVYVSPGGDGGSTHENFVIQSNRIARPGRLRHSRFWKPIALSADRGWYDVRHNAVS